MKYHVDQLQCTSPETLLILLPRRPNEVLPDTINSFPEGSYWHKVLNDLDERFF